MKLVKTDVMKQNFQPNTKPQNEGIRQKPPENKDNLDSRKNEEQDIKGDDITHNKKKQKGKTRNTKSK